MSFIRGYRLTNKKIGWYNKRLRGKEGGIEEVLTHKISNVLHGDFFLTKKRILLDFTPITI